MAILTVEEYITKIYSMDKEELLKFDRMLYLSEYGYKEKLAKHIKHRMAVLMEIVDPMAVWAKIEED